MPDPLNTQQVQARFSAASLDYEHHARIQKRVAHDLWHWAKKHTEAPPPQTCIDIGSGTGFLTQHILAAYPNTPVHAIDLAQGMLSQLKNNNPSPQLQTHLLNGEHVNTETLQVPKQSLTMSSMCVQWFNHPAQALAKWIDISNTVAISVLLDGSFDAWRAAHRDTGQACGLLTLPKTDDFEQVIEQLRHTHAIKTSRMVKEYLDHHPNGLSFARSLRAIGADTPQQAHKPANLRKVIRALGTGCTLNYRIAYYFLERS